jgi:cyclic-di-GMP phosphodiesterase TipF (flagellum assembly factor)
MGGKTAAHLVFALGYTAVAVLLTLAVPALRPGTDPLVALLAGIQAFQLGLLAHFVFWQGSGVRRLSSRVQRMRKVYEELAEITLHSRQDVISIKRAVRTGDHAAAGHGESEGRPSAPATVDEPPPPHPLPLPAVEPAPVLELHAVSVPVPAASAPPAAVPSAPPSAESVPPMEDRTLVEIIQAALADGRVEAFLLPFVRLPKRNHRFFEVLARIALPDGEVLRPDRFLAVARREKLITAIDRVMLVRAMHFIEETERRHHVVGFFCNVASATIATPQALTRVLDHAAIQPSLRRNLIFELSQRDFEAGGPALSQVAELGRQGFRFSMDGVDHLSFDPERLLTHHVNYIKISAPLLLAPENRAQVLELRHRLTGLPVELLAEKVETESQLAEIAFLGFEYAGGYLFSAPRRGRRQG